MATLTDAAQKTEAAIVQRFLNAREELRRHFGLPYPLAGLVTVLSKAGLYWMLAPRHLYFGSRDGEVRFATSRGPAAAAGHVLPLWKPAETHHGCFRGPALTCVFVAQSDGRPELFILDSTREVVA